MKTRHKIIHKLLLGYAAYLLIAIFFGVYVYTNIQHIRVKQRLVEAAEDARDEVLELRRNEKNFIIRRSPEYLDNIHAITGALRTSVANLGPDIIAAFGTEDYSALKDSIELYASLTDRFGEDYKAEASLTERFRDTGRAMEAAVLSRNDPATTREALELRLMEKNYVLFKDREYIDRLRQGVSGLKTRIPTPEIRRLCENYLSTADMLAASGEKEAALLVRVRAAANGIQTIIEKVDKRERYEIESYLVNSQRLLLGALFVLAVAGPLFMLYMARAITAPLIRLKDAARLISEGDEDIRVKVEGDLETASLQQSFNVMLNKLQDSRDSLEDTVLELREKNAMLIEAEKLASIGVLASGVAHEINNPLANIMLTAETAQSVISKMPEGELGTLLEDIISETERARSVVTGLLDYTRGMRDEAVREVDLRETVGRSVRLIAHQAAINDANITEEYADRPLPVLANSGRIEQVFVNLMLNAIQAMDKGGRLSVTVRGGGHNAVVEVKDSGRGIPPEDMKRIFDPFFTTKPVGRGTGLGLYVSYGIVKDHGGEMEVESMPGEGALFRVRLPLSRGKNAG